MKKITNFQWAHGTTCQNKLNAIIANRADTRKRVLPLVSVHLHGDYCKCTSRALSLRNLVGNECGRVFPAGVGPGSPSRDPAN